ncbi:transposase [Thalassotalea litorea]|uniref:transposase n=1 Tax=Thalassotalea litorea TaxID=2020715 RepID=UPI003735C0EF
MPRKARNYFANTPYLIFQFGHNFQPCFFEPLDYQFFIDLVETNGVQYQVQLNKYQLFNNQFFMVITAAHSHSIPKVLQSSCSIYGRYVNDKYHRTGSLWQGRHKASPVQAGQFLEAVYEFMETPILPRQFNNSKNVEAQLTSADELSTNIISRLLKNQAIGDSTFLQTVNNHKLVQLRKTIVPRTRNGLMPLLSDKPGIMRT